MAVKIRLKRMGKIRQPYYRVVVVDARKKRDGKVIEEIGKYHPKLEPSLIQVTSERAQYWLGVGAQPTEAVEVLLKVTGDWQRFKGLPGTEGTLRTAEPKRDKTEIFNEALKDAASEPKAGATTARKKAASKADAPKADAPKADAPKADAPKADVAKKETAAQAPVAPEAAKEAPEVSAEESAVTTEAAAEAEVAQAEVADAETEVAADADAPAEQA